jgi:DNA-binding HxlR family transcriptional regulator
MTITQTHTYKHETIKTEANGINLPPAGHTVSKGGINRSKQPYSSGIYSVTIEAPKSEGEEQYIEKREVQKTPRKPPGYPTFRRYRRLHTHKITIILETKHLDVNTTAQDLVRLLNLKRPEGKHTTGEDFDTWVYSEKRGETLTISFNHKTRIYFIRLDTHKTLRADTLLDYAHRILRISTVKTLELEVYVRYLERYELKVAKAVDALDLEIGKGLKQHLIPNKGKHDYYLSRAKLKYKDAEVDVKTYRSRYYKKHSPTEAEYHPKIEQLTRLRQIPIGKSVKDIIKEYATLIYTIAYTINPRIILGEYELTETETIEVYEIDKTIQRYIRGITKRIKIEVILEEQYPDKRIAIAKLLVEKKMRPIDIARLLGYSKRWITQIIEELVESGVIKRVGRGKYEWGNRKAKLEKKQLVESRQMTLQQAIQFIRENKAHIVNSKGTLVVEYEDEYTIRRVVVSNILIEEDQIIEQLAGRTRIYRIPRNRLRQLITQDKK